MAPLPRWMLLDLSMMYTAAEETRKAWYVFMRLLAVRVRIYLTLAEQALIGSQDCMLRPEEEGTFAVAPAKKQTQAQTSFDLPQHFLLNTFEQFSTLRPRSLHHLQHSSLCTTLIDHLRPCIP